ncbi:MAG: hypothetical protein AB1746_09130 [Candidatus Zixiibacteriota bacterium]
MSEKTLIKLLSLIIIITIIFGTAQAGVLDKKSRVELRLGGWVEAGDSKVAVLDSDALTSVKTGLPMGGVGFSHWLNEKWALFVSVTAMSSQTDTRIEDLGLSTNTSIISSLMFGGRRYITMSDPNTMFRPYLEGGAGAFVASQEKSSIGLRVIYESTQEATFGGRIGGGFDFLLGRKFTLGACGLYNIMADFDNPIGNRKNYNGVEFNIVFGYLFGGGSK